MTHEHNDECRYLGLDMWNCGTVDNDTLVDDEQIADASLANYGNMSILTPLTADGWLWVDENLADERTEYAGGIVIEHRYVNPILEAMDRYGLTVDFLSD